MKAYMYRAAFLCEDCAKAEMARLGPMGDREDSDQYPQGPYPHGGGEADSPQHCDACGLFLENPLTTDGYNYVVECLASDREFARGNPDVMQDWQSFYGITDAEVMRELRRRHAAAE